MPIEWLTELPTQVLSEMPSEVPIEMRNPGSSPKRGRESGRGLKCGQTGVAGRKQGSGSSPELGRS